MATVTAEMVKELRERTGAGMMDCKKALDANNGDMDKSVEDLQKKGLAKAVKKSGRIAAEGIVYSYIHAGNKLGVLLEINCESDFVAKNEEFIQFAEDVAMQIAAMNPSYIKSEEIAPEEINKQKEIFIAQMQDSGKPEKVVMGIVEGKVKKWFSDVCLYNQAFIKDEDKTIDELRQALIAKTGENINIRRFVRYTLGEGIEKKQCDLQAEVEATIKSFQNP